MAYVQQDFSTTLSCNATSGTKPYMAPEIFSSSHAHGSSADYWSLGVTMFELFFFKKPFARSVPLSYVELASADQSDGNNI